MSVQAISMQAPPVMPTTSSPKNVEPVVANPTAEIAKPEASKSSVNSQELTEAVEAVKRFVQPMASNLDFSIDEATGIKVVKVIDTATEEVIRQFPSEEILQIAKALDKLQGILIEQKA